MIGINGDFLETIRRLYLKTHAILNNDSTNWFSVNSGVKQDVFYHPHYLIFNINDLVEYLKTSPTARPLNFGKLKVDCLLYADDLVI